MDIKYVHSIEMEKDKNRTALEADNLKILPSLDLSVYKVIGMDAYGIPERRKIDKLRNINTSNPKVRDSLRCYILGLIFDCQCY